MPYVVLARKYRPRSFAQMVGQAHVVQALSNALASGRLHHAYLFTGTRGIGKTTVSRILAKSLNCTGVDGKGGITAEPCGVCQACTEIDADRYLDYIELDAASNRSIDEIRDLIERAAYKPGIGRFKVFMIDEAHQLTKDAFNALLKTLEEPPDYLKFVLATTDPEKMLPTVLSRCLQFNLRPMAPATVREHLHQVLQAEGVPADEGSLRLLARAARGSMRDGLSLTDQAIAYGSGRLDEAVVRAMLGSVDRSHARVLVEALAARDGTAVLAAVEGLRGLGLSAAGTLEEMALLLQQMAVQQVVPGALDAHDPDSTDACALAPLLAPDETQLLYSMVLHGRDELGLMSDEYAALTMVLLRFLAFAADAGAAALAVAPAVQRPVPPGAPGAPVSRDIRSLPLRAPAAPAVAAVRLPVAEPAAASEVATLPASKVAEPPSPAPWGASSPAVGSTLAPADSAASASSADSSGSASAAASAALAAVSGTPAESVAMQATAPAGSALPASLAPQQPGTIAAGHGVVDGSPDAAAQGLDKRWHQIVRHLSDKGSIAALQRELALQAGLLRIDESAIPPVWHLMVEREPLRSPGLADKLAAAIELEWGQALRIELHAGLPADSPARREAAAQQRLQSVAEETIHNDPVVRALLTQFKGARIVPGSIKPVSPQKDQAP